jgi:hypothetical protein
MNRHSSPPGHSKHHAKRSVWVWSLVALFASGAGLAVWQRFKAPTVTPERGSISSVPRESEPRTGSWNSPATRTEAGAAAPATTQAMRELERLKSAWMAALAQETPMEQDAGLSRCLEEMTPEMAATLLTSLKAEELRTGDAQRLFDHWATESPQDAIIWAQKQGDPQIHQPFLTLAAMRWAVVDLSEAMGWARSLPAGDFRSEVLEAVASEAVRSAPIEALRLGVELPKGGKQAELLARAAAEWAVTDRDSALDWAKQIEDDDLRQQVTGQLVAAFANQDPVRAATTALQEMVPGVEQDRAVVTIIQHWAQSAPEDAAAWVSQFPDDSLAQDAIESLVNLWGDQDLAAPGSWLKSLPPSAMRDHGILAYSRALQKTDPELAKQWAASVTSPIKQ